MMRVLCALVWTMAAWACLSGRCILAQQADAGQATKPTVRQAPPIAEGAPPAAATPQPAANPAEAGKAAENDEQVAEEGSGSQFIRVVRDDKGEPTAMQTSVARYARPGKPAAKGKKAEPETVVDLIGAVHIGEPAYYEELNRRFTGYDAVLYELVAPKDHVPQKKVENSSLLSVIQRGMKDMLELEFQLDWIDYKAHNFVHADMSPDELFKSMDDRGETVWSIVLRAMTQGMAMQAQNPNQNVDAELLLALFDKNRALKLKRVVAKQFEDVEAAMAMFEGPNGSVLISERNKKALDVLGAELKSGKRRLAIFYGAGHMPDFEERLVKEFGFKRKSDEWITAWDLADKPQPRKPNDATPME